VNSIFYLKCNTTVVIIFKFIFQTFSAPQILIHIKSIINYKILSVSKLLSILIELCNYFMFAAYKNSLLGSVESSGVVFSV
jgi:hypothetical protein